MRLHRFYVEEKIGTETEVTLHSPALFNQFRNVFRLKSGDQVILFDGSGKDFVVSIEDFEKDAVRVSVSMSEENKTLPSRETYLFASLVKKDTFEWIAQKATELGVSHIIPVMSARSEKKNLNDERLRKIIIEAAEQSGRATLPELHDIIDLEAALLKFRHIPSVVWHTNSPKFVSQDVEGSFGAYIGPEGGWSDSELSLFKKYNLPLRSLGPQVLRAETAVIAVISRLVF
ncbi:MAG: RsmE family RNA methyltransferase [Patescibacteria group bacterium]